MELKTKYQYTYFIKPFLIKESKYEKYLFSLLEKNNCSLKMFEKEKDLGLYSFFLENTRKYFFPTFNFTKEKIRDFNKLNSRAKARMISNFHCNIFEYKIQNKVQGKVETEGGIFFDIAKIEIVCLDTGVCFLVLKTYLENTNKFSDVLNFNYKFKDINSEYLALKPFGNIKIQTNTFENMKDLSGFIKDITGISSNSPKLKNIDIYNNRFFVYTYSCINQDEWNNQKGFENIENDFIKYSNVMANEDNLDFNNTECIKSMETLAQYRYARFGFTKQSSSLLCSSMDINNYTKLLFEYETNYLYTLIISLYERIYLKQLSIECKNKNNMYQIRKKFTKFTKEIWEVELSNSLTGTMLFKKWKNVFELDEIYNQIKDEYNALYKDLKIESNNKTNKIVTVCLIVSILLNIVNLIALMRLR